MVVSVICITFANEIKTHIGMKLYIITEINIVDYEDVERTPQVFVNEDEARNAFKERQRNYMRKSKTKTIGMLTRAREVIVSMRMDMLVGIATLSVFLK